MKTKVMFLPNGTTLALRDNEPVSDLQENWVMLYVHLVAALGIDVTEFEFVLPYGNRAVVDEVGGSLVYHIKDTGATVTPEMQREREALREMAVDGAISAIDETIVQMRVAATYLDAVRGHEGCCCGKKKGEAAGD